MNKDVNIPIILIFGWAGDQDRYLTKYSKISEDQEFAYCLIGMEKKKS